MPALRPLLQGRNTHADVSARGLLRQRKRRRFEMTTHAMPHDQTTLALPRWLIVGFISGAVSVLLFHQGAAALLQALALTPRVPYSLEPTAPFGIPQLWSLAFWGGVWGVLLAAALARPFPLRPARPDAASRALQQLAAALHVGSDRISRAVEIAHAFLQLEVARGRLLVVFGLVDDRRSLQLRVGRADLVWRIIHGG